MKPDFTFLCIRISHCTLFKPSAPIQAQFTQTWDEERERSFRKSGEVLEENLREEADKRHHV